jgi:hypothetical protein
MKKLLVVLCLVLFCGCGPLHISGEYDVTGSGGCTSADITYATPDGGTGQVTGVTLPWSYSFTATLDGSNNDSVFVNVIAQNDQSSGTVTTSIKKNGSVAFGPNYGTGAYAIATSTGSFTP